MDGYKSFGGLVSTELQEFSLNRSGTREKMDKLLTLYSVNPLELSVLTTLQPPKLL